MLLPSQSHIQQMQNISDICDSTKDINNCTIFSNYYVEQDISFTLSQTSLMKKYSLLQSTRCMNPLQNVLNIAHLSHVSTAGTFPKDQEPLEELRAKLSSGDIILRTKKSLLGRWYFPKVQKLWWCSTDYFWLFEYSQHFIAAANQFVFCSSCFDTSYVKESYRRKHTTDGPTTNNSIIAV